MKKKTGLVAMLITVLLVLPFLTGVPGKASEEKEIQKLIETASTPEDHIKIADYYEKQAVIAERKADHHASMAVAYKNRGKPLPGLAKHCDNLAQKYTEAAGDYKAMATEHREMAKEKQ